MKNLWEQMILIKESFSDKGLQILLLQNSHHLRDKDMLTKDAEAMPTAMLAKRILVVIVSSIMSSMTKFKQLAKVKV